MEPLVSRWNFSPPSARLQWATAVRKPSGGHRNIHFAQQFATGKHDFKVLETSQP